jgi:benzoyl-CoA-dihydrodiol lyase
MTLTFSHNNYVILFIMSQTAEKMVAAAKPAQPITFQRHPDTYQHWVLEINPPIATLKMNVNEAGGLFSGYELKLNSYDIGVDIELYDAIQRLRIEHPEVKTVILTSNRWNMFCAGANIRMLGGAAHGHKVNFCKFTNETRNSIEDASEFSGQTYLCAINGTAAGGGYEVAAACDYLVLIDDGNAAVSLPEVPLLAVLPGTGGLTRVTDKRKVRRDHADIFCTVEEGIRGQKAVDWRLVDETVPSSKFEERVEERAQEMAAASPRLDGPGINMPNLNVEIDGDQVNMPLVKVVIDRNLMNATVTVHAPEGDAPTDADDAVKQGASWYMLDLVRQLDEAILHLRFNEPDIGTVIFKTQGDSEKFLAQDAFMNANADASWLINETMLYWKRTLKRIDLTSRTLFTFVEPGSCFVGVLAELLFAVDRTYMLEGQFEDGDNNAPAAEIILTDSNFGPFPMPNGITRLETRFLGEP